MEVATRRVHFAGRTSSPNEPWMKQIARNLIDCLDGFMPGARYLLMDRDAKYCEACRFLLPEANVKPVRLPARSPNLNPHLERVLRSLKAECLDRMILFGERSFRRGVGQFLAHYHQERNHQGLGNRLIEARTEVGQINGEIQCRERLGGLLKYYYRDAA